MAVQHGAGLGHDRMSLSADFGIATPVGALSPPTTGASVLLEAAGGAAMIEAHLPPGRHWTSRRGRWVYRDASGSIAGVRRLEVVNVTRGGVPEVSVTLTARKGSYPVTFAELPLTLTIVLGDEASGLAGACGRHAFDAATCNSIRGGARVACR